MFTSDKTADDSRYITVLDVYLSVTVFSALFGAVYELFSHGVYSYCMIYAFAFPMLLGVLPFFGMWKRRKAFPGLLAAQLIHAGIAALCIGSIVQGIIEIYGTENVLINVYWIVGGMLTAAGWLLAVLRKA